jgi:hypothetical protein
VWCGARVGGNLAEWLDRKFMAAFHAYGCACTVLPQLLQFRGLQAAELDPPAPILLAMHHDRRE